MKFEHKEEEIPENVFYTEKQVKDLFKRFSRVIQTENQRFDRKLIELERKFKMMALKLEYAFDEKFFKNQLTDEVSTIIEKAHYLKNQKSNKRCLV